MSELSRLRRLRGRFAGPQPAGVLTGIGDDAAVLCGSELAQVWTIDSAVEGKHFKRDWMSLQDIGYRSLMAAASDLAAMGASPRGVLSSLVLPASFSDDELDQLVDGQKDAACALGTALIGGNLSAGGELSITTTVLGQTTRPLLRSGARPGDHLAVAGPLGLARAALEALQSGQSSPLLHEAMAVFRRPLARIAQGEQARDAGAHAAIDLSDGLVLDAARLAEESGVGLVLRERDVLACAGVALAEAAAVLSRDPLQLALFGGEDYALLATFPDRVPLGFWTIGHVETGSGVLLESATGERSALNPRGFDHFAPA